MTTHEFGDNYCGDSNYYGAAGWAGGSTWKSTVVKDSAEAIAKIGYPTEINEKDETVYIKYPDLPFVLKKEHLLAIKYPNKDFHFELFYGENLMADHFWFFADITAAIRGKSIPPRIQFAEHILSLKNPIIGAKVIKKHELITAIYDAVGKFMWGSPIKKDYGKAALLLPDSANDCILPAYGKRTVDPDDYVLRLYNGVVRPFLKRAKAEPHRGIVVNIVDKKKEAEALGAQNTTEVIDEYFVNDLIVIGGPSSDDILTEADFVKQLVDGTYNSANVAELAQLVKKMLHNNKNWCLVSD